MLASTTKVKALPHTIKKQTGDTHSDVNKQTDRNSERQTDTETDRHIYACTQTVRSKISNNKKKIIQAFFNNTEISKVKLTFSIKLMTQIAAQIVIQTLYKPRT